MSFIRVVDSENGVVEVFLNRPGVRNAFNPGMIEELTQCFSDFSCRSDISLILLAGEGESFCAGADLAWMKSMADYTLQENIKDSEALFKMFETMALCEHPIVGKAHGHVMGGALGLLSVCDVVAADENTVFCFSEAKLGLVPAVISSFVMRKMSFSKANELMLTARRFRSLEAMSSGLIHFSGTSEEVEIFVSKAVKNILMNGSEAMRLTKKLLLLQKGSLSDEVRQSTTRVISECRVSEEGQEGLKSFFEKREPSWRKL